MTTTSPRFASFKLRFHENRVRAVPLLDLRGNPFVGPGIDVVGEEASAVLSRAGRLRAWLTEREPGVVIRAISVDWSKRIVLVTAEATPMNDRTRVFRFTAPYADELLELARDVEDVLWSGCCKALRRRAPAPRTP